MSWTIACFCGTLYQTPLERCPTCATPLPDVRSDDPIDTATHDAAFMLPDDASAAPMGFGARFGSAGPHEVQLPADLHEILHTNPIHTA